MNEHQSRPLLAPSALVILSPLVAGMGFGKNCCAGLLSGALVSSVQLAISMSNTGGSWDNSKKYISAGGLGKEFMKGSEAHKNSVTGHTVGDPVESVVSSGHGPRRVTEVASERTAVAFERDEPTDAKISYQGSLERATPSRCTCQWSPWRPV